MDFLQSIFGFLILILDIWAIIDIIGSNKSVAAKILWVLAIIFLPLVGLILYVIFGRGRLAVT